MQHQLRNDHGPGKTRGTEQSLTILISGLPRRKLFVFNFVMVVTLPSPEIAPATLYHFPHPIEGRLVTQLGTSGFTWLSFLALYL